MRRYICYESNTVIYFIASIEKNRGKHIIIQCKYTVRNVQEVSNFTPKTAPIPFIQVKYTNC